MIFSLKSEAQNNAHIAISNFWENTNGEASVEDQVLSAIVSLKKAEASMEDSITVDKLESIGYLAIIKSGFTSSNVDKFQRKGWWMLSYPVAVKYGLTINSIIDERMDLVESTKAAYNYWENLNDNYGNSAELAFLESPIAVSKFLKDSINYFPENKKIKKTAETLENVKAIYEKNQELTYVGPIQVVVSVSSKEIISFESIHHFLQIPSSKLKSLNPKWISDLYDPQYGDLLLPSKYQDEFMKQVGIMEQKTRDNQILLAAKSEKRMKQLKGNIPDLESYKPIRYKVKMGDNLGRIGERYNVKISHIRSWNELKSDRIYAGQKLTLYIPINQEEFIDKAPKPKVQKSKLKVGEYQEYTVQAGDTLWGISQKFEKISADHIMADNGIDENIAPGQVLKIRIVE